MEKKVIAHFKATVKRGQKRTPVDPISTRDALLHPNKKADPNSPRETALQKFRSRKEKQSSQMEEKISCKELISHSEKPDDLSTLIDSETQSFSAAFLPPSQEINESKDFTRDSVRTKKTTAIRNLVSSNSGIFNRRRTSKLIARKEQLAKEFIRRPNEEEEFDQECREKLNVKQKPFNSELKQNAACPPVRLDPISLSYFSQIRQELQSLLIPNESQRQPKHAVMKTQEICDQVELQITLSEEQNGLQQEVNSIMESALQKTIAIQNEQASFNALAVARQQESSKRRRVESVEPQRYHIQNCFDAITREDGERELYHRERDERGVIDLLQSSGSAHQEVEQEFKTNPRHFLDTC